LAALPAHLRGCLLSKLSALQMPVTAPVQEMRQQQRFNRCTALLIMHIIVVTIAE
jgi:hypothetical protein